MAEYTITSTHIFIFIAVLALILLFLLTYSFMTSPKYRQMRETNRVRRLAKQRQAEETAIKISVAELAPKKTAKLPQDSTQESEYTPYIFWKPKFTLNPSVWLNPLVWFKVWSWRRIRKKALVRIVARIQTTQNETIQIMTPLRADNSFTWLKGRYVCDEKTAKYNMTAKMDEYFFHKDLSLSLNINTPVSEIKQAIIEAQKPDGLPILEVYHDLDPRILQHYVEAEAGKVAITANSIGAFFKRMFAIAVFTLFLIIIFIAIYGFQSGLFETISQ